MAISATKCVTVSVTVSVAVCVTVCLTVSVTVSVAVSVRVSVTVYVKVSVTGSVTVSHCLIVKCRGTYQQQVLTNSRTRKVDQKVLQEQVLCTSIYFIFFFFFVVVIFRFFKSNFWKYAQGVGSASAAISHLWHFWLMTNDQKWTARSQDR